MAITIALVGLVGAPALPQQPAVRCFLTNPQTDACAVFRLINIGNSKGGYGWVDRQRYCNLTADSYCSIAVSAGTHNMAIQVEDGTWCSPDWTGYIPAGQEVTYTCRVR